MLQFPAFSSPLHTIAFTVSFGCWALFEMWVFSRDRGRQRTGARGSPQWFILAIALGITLAFNMPGVAPALDIRAGFPVAFATGLLFMWTGLAFRFWSIQTLGSLFSTRLMIQDRHELITTGPTSTSATRRTPRR